VDCYTEEKLKKDFMLTTTYCARFYSIDIDIRSLSDYLILKAQGLQGLTKDLSWLYAYIEPHTLRKL
jgi:hypothetical protein